MVQFVHGKVRGGSGVVGKCALDRGCASSTYGVGFFLGTGSLTFSLIYVGRSIKTHLYWATKNCGEDPDKLCALIMNRADH